MPVTIGSPPPPADLVGLLLECHGRIRRYARVACELSRGDGLDVAVESERCRRYFEVALPLHVADEERSLRPRLAGLGAEVDEALATMGADHAAHEPDLAALLAALRDLEAAPDSPAVRARLGAVAEPLAADFERHLALEERVLFPVVRAALAPEVQREVIAEMRGRRDP